MEYELAQLWLAETLFQEEGQWAEANQCRLDIIRVQHEHSAMREHIILQAEDKQAIEA